MTPMNPVADRLLDQLADARDNAELAAVLVAWWGQDGPREKAAEALDAVDAAVRDLRAVREALATEIGGTS